MALNIKRWLGEISTMVGALIAAPVTVALMQQQISVKQAIPGILAAVVGLMWPENRALASGVEATATDVVQLLPALMAAYEHGRSVRVGAISDANAPSGSEQQTSSSSSSH